MLGLQGVDYIFICPEINLSLAMPGSGWMVLNILNSEWQ